MADLTLERAARAAAGDAGGRVPRSGASIGWLRSVSPAIVARPRRRVIE
jgi:hypothetical protein